MTLDEDLLTDLLELPGWVRLTSAKCNKATFRIQWTKLKTVPIVLVIFFILLFSKVTLVGFNNPYILRNIN